MEEHTERTFLDQLDINNDGEDEVVTEEYLYESHTYTVWEFDRNQKIWTRRYSGGG